MKAIIIGGGIGGLTTAIALQQQGIAYEIYEAAAHGLSIALTVFFPVHIFEYIAGLAMQYLTYFFQC